MNLIVRQTLIIIVIQSISLCSISQECSIFYDDFETGTYSPTWTTGTAFSANGVTTTNVADGVYSIEGTNSGSRPHLGGYKTVLPQVTPCSISWYMFTEGTGSVNHFVVGPTGMTPAESVLFCFWRGPDSEIRFVSNPTLSIVVAPNNWYFIEALNIDWINKTMDIHIDGVLQMAGLPFRDPVANDISEIHLYNFTAGTGYWDNVCLGTCVALPVEMISFNSSCINNENALDWQTASENNSDYFEIQRSRDGFNFSTIGTLPAAGNSSQVISYSFIDKNSPNGISYYRLKQVDFDGKYELFQIISSNCKEQNELKIYPNPSSNKTTMELSVQNNQMANMTILSMTGKLIEHRILDLSTGVNQFNLDPKKYSDGTYYIQLILIDEILTAKWVIVK